MTNNRRRGFALLAVIWGLALIAMFSVSFMTTARLRLHAAYNISESARAGEIANAVITISILALLSEERGIGQRRVHAGDPFICVFDETLVSVSIEDESGKVDLNEATPSILVAMFQGLGLDKDRSKLLTDAITAYRAPAPTGGASRDDSKLAPKNARFDTALELDQVDGFSPQLFRETLPFVTVYSHRPGINAQAAPPALFAALSGASGEDVQRLIKAPYPNKLNRSAPSITAEFLSTQQGPGSGAYSVHVEILHGNGQSSVREAIIETPASEGGALRIRELRGGKEKNQRLLRDSAQIPATALMPC